MKKLLSLITLGLLVFCLPALAQGQNHKITINQVEHAVMKVTYYDNTTNKEVVVQSGDEVAHDTFITVEVKVDEGWAFKTFILNGAVTRPSFGTSLFSRVLEDMTLSVELIEVKPCTLTIEKPANGAIKVISGRTYKEVKSGSQLTVGDQVSLSLVPDEGYEMEHWLINDKVLPKDEMSPNYYRGLVLEGDTKISAKLKQLPPAVALTTSVDPAQGGFIRLAKDTATGSLIQDTNKIQKGTKICATVRTEDGYSINHWLLNDEVKKPNEDLYERNRIYFTMEQDTKLVAVLNKPATLTASVDPAAGGKLTYFDKDKGRAINDTSLIPTGTNVTVTLAPTEGYSLKHWKLDGVEQAPDASKPNEITFAMNGDKTLVAVMNSPSSQDGDWKITLEVEGKGTLTAAVDGKDVPNGSLVKEAAYVTFTAIPAEGYVLDKIYVNGVEQFSMDGKTVGAEIYQDTKVKAVFKEPEKFAVTYSAGENGSLTAQKYIGEDDETAPLASGESVVNDTRVLFTATPNAGYLVDQWTINGEVDEDYAGESSISFYVNSATEVKVSFKQKPVSTTGKPVTFASDANGKLEASVEGIAIASGDKLDAGKKIVFKATPKNWSYQINKWLVNGAEQAINADDPYTLELTMGEEALDVKVSFKEKQYTLTFETDGNGTLVAKQGETALVSPAAVKGGAQVTLTATPNEGFKIKGWLVNGLTDFGKGQESEVEIEVYEDTSVKVEFEEVKKYTVTYTAGDHGTLTAHYEKLEKEIAVASGSQVTSGTFVTFVATPESGYEVSEWTIDGVVDSKQGKAQSIRKEVESNLEVKVSFVKKEVPVKKYKVEITSPSSTEGTLVVSDKSGTTIATGSEVAEGSTLTITAEALGAYDLKYFTINGKQVSREDAKVVKVSDKKYSYEVVVKSTMKVSATFYNPTSVEEILSSTEGFAIVNGQIYCPRAEKITLYSLEGNVVKGVSGAVLDVRTVAQGSYIVIAQDREGVLVQKKVIL